jgi:hypothetical protein
LNGSLEARISGSYKYLPDGAGESFEQKFLGNTWACMYKRLKKSSETHLVCMEKLLIHLMKSQMIPRILKRLSKISEVFGMQLAHANISVTNP